MGILQGLPEISTGNRLDIPDTADIGGETLTVGGLIEFLQRLDPSMKVVWAGRDQNDLIIVSPAIPTGHLYMCESVTHPNVIG